MSGEQVRCDPSWFVGWFVRVFVNSLTPPLRDADRAATPTWERRRDQRRSGAAGARRLYCWRCKRLAEVCGLQAHFPVFLSFTYTYTRHVKFRKLSLFNAFILATVDTCFLLLTGDVGSKSTNHELMKRVRAAYDNRLRELRDALDQTSDKGCQRNAVDKSSSLSEKRLDVLLRKLNDLKKANVSCACLCLCYILPATPSVSHRT